MGVPSQFASETTGWPMVRTGARVVVLPSGRRLASKARRKGRRKGQLQRTV